MATSRAWEKVFQARKVPGSPETEVFKEWEDGQSPSWMWDAGVIVAKRSEGSKAGWRTCTRRDGNSEFFILSLLLTLVCLLLNFL